MNREFVPYELALKLKELGFDEPCFGRFSNEGDLLIAHTEKYIISNGVDRSEFFTQAPTYSQVFKFFRDNYRLSVLIHDCLDDYIGEIVEWTLTDDKIIHEVPNRIETYEETELKSLEKLIEIVESKSK